MSKPPATHVHAYYQHAEEAFRELPDAIGQLERLRDAFRKADEDFLAIEMKSMIARLEEIRTLLGEGPQG
ncbi:hypothetical protein GZH47_29735 [Paenibacillus rhizovicinus]|uniref:Uncharacterized protein n=1 Tax=Paenibacillus rhizovicinus TaxID=2704463 RepID=A0A6C0P7N4_9BACL|nr:hypothetical protein [Paenibacillus rhizovicinus]QHW34564.1 hypothetical protein GZH47_29735 [Paenibacillus rhizovicinus]